MQFDPTAARARLESLWKLSGKFGSERDAEAVCLDLVTDRYTLVRGLQLLRDELQFAATRDEVKTDLAPCGADFSLPSVVTTLAHTNCGDRIHQSGITSYQRLVASRFATMSPAGEVKPEAFFPTGGGTDDGATLAHVTVGHQLDELLRKWVYQGHAQSFVLVNMDLKTHVGRLDEGATITFGKAQESPWREPRAACGAIVGALSHFSDLNAVHRRIRHDLGEDNFQFLTAKKLVTKEGIDIAAAVAAAIVAIQGMRNTMHALTRELDDRGLAHLTASLTINRVSGEDTTIHLGRGTVFENESRSQGLGTDATKYGGEMVEHAGERRLRLTYDGHHGGDFAVETSRYQVPRGKQSTRLIAIPDDIA